MKKLKELSPHALLAAVFLLSLNFFALVALFPSWFYRTMDVASYLVFHNIAEFFSVMVSLSIFSVGWFTYEQSKNRHALFLGCAFLAVGLMDFMHTLSYSGMPAFITQNSSLKSTQFWIAVRMYSALTFFVSGYVYPGSSGRLLSKGFLLASAVAVSGVVFAGVIYFPSYLPATIIEGQGVTPLKRYSEYLIMLLLALSIPAYWRRNADTGRRELMYIMAALIICIFSELAFSGYKSVFDTYNVLGHIYKIIAFALIYQGIFIATVKYPYREVVRKTEEIRIETKERIRAEEALRESYKRFGLVLDSMDALVYVADMTSYEILFLNRYGREIWGDAVGKTCWQTLQSGQTGPCPFCPNSRLVLPSGEAAGPLVWEFQNTVKKRWYECRDQAIRWADGRLVHMEIASDITERKQTEEQLQYQATLLTKVNDAIIGSDAQYRITIWNAQAEAIYGWKAEEVLGRNGLEITRTEWQGKDAEKMRRLIEAKGQWRGEVTQQRKDGTRFSVEISSLVIRLDSGQIKGYISVNRDITERKQAEEEMKRLSHQISLILNSAGEGIYGVDMDGKVTFVNPAAARMLGYEVEELIGRQSHATWHHSYPDGTPFPIEQCSLNNVLKEGAPTAAENVVFWKKDGTQLPVEYNSTPMSEAGKLVGAVVTFKDITSHLLEEQERRKLEEQLRHAQKMEAVGTLAGGVAHDFNNILNVIIGYGTMVLDRLGDDPLSKEQVNEVLAAADRAANLTKRLLTFSRKQVVDVKPVNVNEIIVGMEKMLSRIISEDIAFTMELASRRMIVMADAGQMEQVLMNLVSNARDVMPKGGRLTISTGIKEMDAEYVAVYGYGKPGTYARISVSDTGSGMDAEIQKKIFEPFFTTKGVGEGTGLGLSIVYGIIKQHNGYINVYSEPGKGTEFKIYLPLIEEDTAKGQEVEAVAPIKGGTETILLAEDDASLRTLSRIVLESFGYSVITAEDGEDAITKYKENRDNIQLVVLDMIMPKKNGKEAYAEIQKIRPDIKALFVSGYTMDIITKKKFLDSGVAIILKPVSPRDLVKKVREVLDR